MFSCDEWVSSKWAHRQDAKETKKKVNDSAFWKKAAEVVKITEPLVIPEGVVISGWEIWPWVTFMRLWIRKRSK